ncbi:hypothetical protein, partial [Acidiphilium sp. MT5]
MEQATNTLAQCLADRFTTIAHMLRKTLGAPEYSRFDLTLKCWGGRPYGIGCAKMGSDYQP